jgi:hypothetical protein
MRAARLAIEEIQAAIDEVDLDVSAEIAAHEDTQTDSTAAVEAANKLVQTTSKPSTARWHRTIRFPWPSR